MCVGALGFRGNLSLNFRCDLDYFAQSSTLLCKFVEVISLQSTETLQVSVVCILTVYSVTNVLSLFEA